MKKIAIFYVIFAVAATIINIFTQYISLLAYNGRFSLYIAMGAGTLSGLIVKYILDKKYIFFYETKSKSEDMVKFMIYSFMGVFTTVIFWGSELAFHAFWDSPVSKYVGAVTGLSIGYVTKYWLDKFFVFK